MKDEVEEGLDAIFSGSPQKPPNFCSLGAMILILNNVMRKFAKRVKKFFKPRKVKQRKESPVDTTENGVGDGGPHSSLSKELKEIITPIVDIVPEEDYEGVFTETATEIQALSEDIAPILTGKKEKKNPLRLCKEKIANLFSKCFLNVWIRHLISQLRKQHPMLRRGDSSESVRSLVVTVTSLVDNDTSLVNGFQEMTSSHKSVFQETTTNFVPQYNDEVLSALLTHIWPKVWDNNENLSLTEKSFKKMDKTIHKGVCKKLGNPNEVLFMLKYSEESIIEEHIVQIAKKLLRPSKKPNIFQRFWYFHG
ncbi:hypothetical protein D4764_10G0010770 [Takifugu flavidus]|uniref:Uncharacterized protein n=1 Tax=Takifugu flavidus TaxID=433684 RepID=A0A5C6PNV8_9TELE|nr:hypothetical protein D4764_10G0010770 [Takifugu flavidus]